MLYFWCILFIWNIFGALGNLMRNQGYLNIITLLSIITAGFSLAEILRNYKKT